MSSTALSTSASMMIVIAGSIIIPGLVAILYVTPKLDFGMDFSMLPLINAVLNTCSATFLVSGFVYIKNGNKENHRRAMMGALVTSTLFLVSYVVYHATSDPTSFGGQGAYKIFYFTILISHIILAIVITPLVLITFVRALAEKFDKHKKIARFTFPLWLYVSVTGVMVYLMISPFY